MNIGFDAKRAFLNYTGLGNYSREVINALSTSFPGETYFLYTTGTPLNNRTKTLLGKGNVHTRKPSLPFLESLWRSRLVVPQLIRDKLDVFHGLSHEIPVGIHKTGIRSVVTIHDLIFLRYPQYYKSVDRKIYDTKYRYACRHADKIIAISEQTKKDIHSFLDVDFRKIEVVYQGCDPVFTIRKAPGTLAGIKEKYRLPDRFLLSVGTVERRKNVLLAVKTLPALPDMIKLVILGRHTSYAGEVKKYLQEHTLEDRVIFLDNIPFEDLPAIYQMAEIFVYPSRFEGFGIPVLEALQSGIPVIAATGSCLEEAGGQGSFYVDPDDENAMADCINAILHDEALRSKMIEEGYRHAQSFSSEIMAAKLMGLYKGLIQ